MVPSSPTVQFRSTETSSASVSGRPSTRSARSRVVRSSGGVSLARRASSSALVCRSKSNATAAMASRSRDRVAFRFRAVHCSNGSVSSSGHPSYAACARAANSSAKRDIILACPPRGSEATSSAAIRRHAGSNPPISSGVK